MAELNGGRLLARCLANEGVRFVFGLPSPEIDPLLAALDEHGMRLVPIRHEAAGAHMAEGLYKTTGQVAVVIGNPGPGSANLLAGVITARHEGVARIAEVADLLAGAVRPLVIAGSGVDRAGANEALLAVVERLGCPVIASMAGRAVVPLDHPNAVYGLGAGGDLAKREADVVLVAGSRLGNLDLPYDKYWGDPATQRVVQIDVDPRHIGVTRPVALGIVADLKPALASLASALEARRARPRDPGFLARCRRAAEEWWREQMRVVEGWAGPGLHPARVIQAIGAAFGPGAIYVTDGGFTSLWAYWFLPPTRPRSYLSILELGMLGTGVPAALGAKLGSPAREVVCVTGDGAAGFHFMEMQSAAREGARITVIVFAA